MLNTSVLNEFINDEFDGNLTKASKAFGISASCLCRIMGGQRNAGMKAIRGIVMYYNQHKGEGKDYIFLDMPLRNVNAI